jgi:ATP-dependent Clp protease, protease subunit
LRKAADVLDEVKETIINAYQLKTGKSRNKISELMDEEAYMSAKTAIKEGFADEMLYLEEKEDTTYNFAFKRCLVLNSTSEAVKRMIDEEKTKENNEISKAKLALALEC